MSTAAMDEDRAWRQARAAAWPAMVVAAAVVVLASMQLGAMAGAATLLLVPWVGLLAMYVVERLSGRYLAGR